MVHCFTAGTQTSAQGVTREFSTKDLKEVAESYDPIIHEAPVRIGHEDTDKSPAYGWVKGFKIQGDRLYADVEFTPEMSGMLRNRNYSKVSISMYSPQSHINPTPGKWSARHLAVLGATPPAVKGLEAIQFSEECFDFADGITLEAIYDPTLGPTLETDNSPIEQLKEAMEEHKKKSTPNTEKMTDEQLKVNPELENEELEVSAEQEEAEFAEHGKKKMSKQGEESMEDEGEDEGKPFSEHGKKKKSMSEDHEEEVSEDHSSCGGDHKNKKKDAKYEEEVSEDHGDCGGGKYERVRKNKSIKDQYYEEDEVDAAHGEETGKATDGVGQDRMKKAKAKDVQGEGGLHSPKSKGKGKENAGHGKSAVHSAAKVPTKKHAYPKGVEVDYEEINEAEELVDMMMEHEQNVSEDHYESPMEMTGDTRMANVVEQITKENQLEAMMNQIEHLSSQVKLVEEENERLRVAAEKAMKDKRRGELQQFVSALYESGKLTDAVMTQEKLVGFCEGLDDGTLEFSEEGETPSGVLLNLLANLPSQVEFGEFGADMFEFEEEEDLSPHELATRIATEESISYVDALKRVLY